MTRGCHFALTKTQPCPALSSAAMVRGQGCRLLGVTRPTEIQPGHQCQHTVSKTEILRSADSLLTPQLSDQHQQPRSPSTAPVPDGSAVCKQCKREE